MRFEVPSDMTNIFRDKISIALIAQEEHIIGYIDRKLIITRNGNLDIIGYFVRIINRTFEVSLYPEKGRVINMLIQLGVKYIHVEENTLTSGIHPQAVTFLTEGQLRDSSTDVNQAINMSNEKL